MDIPTRGRPRKNPLTVKRRAYCVYGLCNNVSTNSRVKFINFPKPCLDYRTFAIERKPAHVRECAECSKCQRWVLACKRADGRFDNLNFVRKDSYICAEHFVGGDGPTNENPDPIPANCVKVYLKRRRKPPHSNCQKKQCNDTYIRKEVEYVNENYHKSESSITEMISEMAENVQCPINDKETQTDSKWNLVHYFLHHGWNVTLTMECIIVGRRSIITEINELEAYINPNSSRCQKLKVFGISVSSEHLVFKSDTSEVINFLNSVFHQWSFCNGCGDLNSLIEDGKIPNGAVIDSSKKFRSKVCALLVEKDSNQCKKCKKLEEGFDKKKNESLEFGKNTSNIRYLTKPALQHRLRALSYASKLQRQKTKRLEKTMTEAIMKKGLILSKEDSKDVTTLLESIVKNSKSQCSEYMLLFLKQQLAALHAKNSKGIRWHPDVLKCCLLIHQKSATTYSALRDLGIMLLPSERILYDLRKQFECQPGFKGANHDKIQKELGIDCNTSASNCKRFVGITFDEMKICEDIVFRKSTGELVGFVQLNELNERLANLKSGNELEQIPVASNVLQLMIRGLSTGANVPFAYFPCENMNADELFSIMWEAVERLELMNIHVIAWIGDGVAKNRKLFSMARAEIQSSVGHYANNIYSSLKHPIFLLPDSSHLIKTARNCCAGSGFSSKYKRLMQKNSKFIIWNHFINTYMKDLNTELRLLHQVTDEHIYLSQSGKMKVRYAVQVLSKRMGIAMDKLDTSTEKECSETVNFIMNMNKYFDLMNCRHPYEGLQSRNDDTLPYYSVDDPRLKWLEKDFINYLKEWEEEVKKKESFSAEQKEKMMLSRQTMQGLQISVKATSACIRFLLRNGASYVLTSKFNQDPLETYFGQQRRAAGTNENPSVLRYSQNSGKLFGIKDCKRSLKGNVASK